MVSFAEAQQTLTTGQILGQLNTINCAVPFLLLTPDGHAGALGETGAATPCDAFNNHWNCAKNAVAPLHSGVGISYNPWLTALLPNVSYMDASGYYKVRSRSAIGLSYRYISYGNITYTNILGNVIGQFTPFEMAGAVSYSCRLQKNWSAGGAIRYIHSDLTNSANINGQPSHPGRSLAFDLSTFHFFIGMIKNKVYSRSFGVCISNLGEKINYTSSGHRDFIPTNLRIGEAFSIELGSKHLAGISLDLNKLLIPTPPVYFTNQSGSLSGGMSGMNPNRSVANSLFTSFYDAPGGWREELREITIGSGFEYTYDRWLKIRTGFFYEAATKGNRKYVTLGFGILHRNIGFDLSYLIPTTQANPLQHTIHVSLSWFFKGASKEKKPKIEDPK